MRRAWSSSRTAARSWPGFPLFAGMGDYDNDGYLDLALAGQSAAGPVSKLYKNYAGTSPMRGPVSSGFDPARWRGRLRRRRRRGPGLAGETGSGAATRVYRSDALIANTAPTPPGGLSTSLTVEASPSVGSAATDSQNGGGRAVVNLRIGRSLGAATCSAAWPTHRRASTHPVDRNAQKRLSWTINGLPNATYYWSARRLIRRWPVRRGPSNSPSRCNRRQQHQRALPGLSNAHGLGRLRQRRRLDLACEASIRESARSPRW